MQALVLCQRQGRFYQGGIALAREVIASGAALEKLRLLQEYQK